MTQENHMKNKTLYERLAIRFVGEGREADRRMYVTVIPPEKVIDYVDQEVIDDVLGGALEGVTGPEDVVYFADNGEFAVLSKSSRRIWTPSYRNLGSWSDITDHFDDETIDFIEAGGVRNW